MIPASHRLPQPPVLNSQVQSVIVDALSFAEFFAAVDRASARSEHEARAEEQRADIRALERMLEARRKELRETESSLKFGRTRLEALEAQASSQGRMIEALRVKSLKELLFKEKGIQEYLDRLNSRTPEGPATSLDSRIYASELELTRKDLAEIRAKIESIRAGQATKLQP
jgi:molybdopterin converting factor small subunit